MLSALPKTNWTYDTAAHLAGRAGFGSSPAQLERWTQQGLEATVQELLHPEADNSTQPSCATPGQFANLRERVQEAMSAEEKTAARRTVRKAVRAQLFELVNWWTQRMLTTPAPLVEKMTLFWHGHFATSGLKVRSPYKLWRQNETLRRHALGNFAALTKAISRDPAMMVYLDLATSKSEHPNENFARELMELFTLGEGNYTEADIRQSARAFTGYRIDRVTENFRFAKNQVDAGNKTFMQQTGDWNGDQIIDIILKQPPASNFICAKIWRYFVYADPEPEVTDKLAEIFRRNYEIRPLLETIFSAEEFYSPRARNALVKSPVQYIVEAGRTLGVSLPTGPTLIQAYRQMGQIPFFPPNVKGWDGGNSWINTATLTFRYQLARQLVLGIRVRGEPQVTPSPQPSASPQVANFAAGGDAVRLPALPVETLVTDEDRADPEATLHKLYARIFQTNPDPQLFDRLLSVVKLKPLPLTDEAIRDLVALMMTTPNYQVC